MTDHDPTTSYQLAVTETEAVLTEWFTLTMREGLAQQIVERLIAKGVIAKGVISEFVCNCECHHPMGFRLKPGQAPPPGMKPCDKCKEAHVAQPVRDNPVSLTEIRSATRRPPGSPPPPVRGAAKPPECNRDDNGVY